MPVADPANIVVGEIDSDMESAASDLQTWMRANLGAGEVTLIDSMFLSPIC